MFAKMLKNSKIYSFSSPMVYLRRKEGVLHDPIKIYSTSSAKNIPAALQKDSYNFVNEWDPVKVTAKYSMRRIWDGFVGIFVGKRWSHLASWFTAVIAFGSFAFVENFLLIALTNFLVSESIVSVMFVVGLSAIEGFVLASLGVLFQDFSVNWGSTYYFSEENTMYVLGDRKFTRRNFKRKSPHIDDHIKNFFSHADFLPRNALPPPTKKHHVRVEVVFTDRTQNVLENQKSLQKESLVEKETDPSANINTQPEELPIAKEPSSFTSLRVITAIILAVLYL